MPLGAILHRIRSAIADGARAVTAQGADFRGHADYRPDVDGLRAVAVLLVVGYHAFPAWIQGGYIGVDVFFVISGYLITRLIQARQESGRFTLRDFYARRVRRIFPALLLVLSAVAIAGLLLFQADELAGLRNALVAGGLFVPNIQIWRETGYFDTAANLKPLLHLWSLGVEEQFYLLWPLALIAIWRLPRHRMVALAILAIASFALNIATVRDYPAATFYLPLTRFWEFLPGAALAIYKPPPLPKAASSWMGAGGLLAILLTGFLLGGAQVYPGWLALIPVLGATAVIWAGMTAWSNRVLLASAVAVFIGLISYPLYLWHWPLLSIARIENFGEDVSPALRLVLVAAAFVLAALTYALVERRIHLRATRIVVPGLLAAMVAVIALSYAALPLAASQRAQNTALDVRQLEWAQWKNQACTARYPWENTRGWWTCMASANRPPSVMLLGDSHANQLFPGLTKALPQQSILNIGTCITIDGLRASSESEGEHPCTRSGKAEQEKLIADIAANSPGLRQVILAGFWPAFTAKGEEADPLTGRARRPQFVLQGSGSQREKFLEGLSGTLRFWEQRNVRPILMLGLPSLPYHVRKCLSRPYRPATETCVLDAPQQHRARASFVALVQQLKQRHPSLLVYDPLPVFCGPATCNLHDGATLFFRDDNHVSMAGSEKLGQDFRAWARSHIPQMAQ